MNLITHILNHFGVNKVPEPLKVLNHTGVITFATNAASTITSIASNMGVIFVYVLFCFSSIDRLTASLLMPYKMKRGSIRPSK